MACDLCDQDGGAVVWQDARCRVVSVDERGYPGFCRVIWNAHVREMTDLDARDQAHLMRVVFAVESTLRELMSPTKMNLATLGNIVPHLHWHVIPRFADDPHFPQPVWGAQQRAPQPGARTLPAQALAQALADRLA